MAPSEPIATFHDLEPSSWSVPLEALVLLKKRTLAQDIPAPTHTFPNHDDPGVPMPRPGLFPLTGTNASPL